MTCLTHAFLSKDIFLSRNEDKLNEPDKNGGFEIGTWNINPLGGFGIIPESESFHSGTDFIHKKGIYYREYSKSEAKRIYKALLKIKRCKYNGEYVYKYIIKEAFGGIGLNIKWTKRLIKLFREGITNPVIEYFK